MKTTYNFLFILGTTICIIGGILMFKLIPIGFKVSAVGVGLIGLGFSFMHYDTYKDKYYD